MADNEGVPMALHKFQDLMGVSRTHIWRLRKAGALKTVNIYGAPYIMPDDLRAFNERAKSGDFANIKLN